jgi:hypothetical protein
MCVPTVLLSHTFVLFVLRAHTTVDVEVVAPVKSYYPV